MGDTVGLVVELLWEEFIEMLEGVFLKDASVDFGDTIDAETSVDSHVRHMDLAVSNDAHLVLLIMGDAFLIHIGVEATVDLLDDHVHPWDKGLDIMDWPLLKGLRHDGVVGVGNRFLNGRPSLIPAIAIFIHHEPHHLRDGEDWVGVIELEHIVFGKMVEGVVSSKFASHDRLKSGGDEEILLTEPKHSAFLSRIVWVKAEGEFLKG